MSKKNKSNPSGARANASASGQPVDEELEAAVRATLAFGWTAVAAFMLGGLALESLHLFKLPAYLESSLRRELWTLAHAHGTLLGILTIALGLTMRTRSALGGFLAASQALRASALLMPAGFFLGGVGNAEGDPSLFIVLVPLGALLAIFAAVTSARALRA